MISNKSINVLSSLNKKELQRFEKFLTSPYFNSNVKLMRLFRLLKKHHPAFDSPRLDKKKMFEYVFGKIKFRDDKLRKLFSDLYKLAEKYLVISNIEANKIEYNNLLLEELDTRKIDNIFYQSYNDAIDSLYDSGFHYHMFLRLHILKWQNVSFHLDRGEQYKVPAEIFERTEQLIFYFLSDLFVSINDISMNKLDFNYVHPTNLPQKFLDSLDLDSIYRYIFENDFKNKELFSMYYYLFLINIQFENEEHFFKLKELFEKNMNSLNVWGKMNFVLVLISYCNAKVKKTGDLKFDKIRLELYGIYIRYELYKANENYFRSDVFLNLFVTYLRQENIEEANFFVEENIKSVNPAHSKNLILLCRALIHFKKNEYATSISIASKIKSNLIFIKISLRKLILKLNYELYDYDVNKEAYNNCREFLNYNKSINKTNRKLLFEFLKIYNDLLRLKMNGKDEYLISQIKENVNGIADPLDKDWFTNKLNFYADT